MHVKRRAVMSEGGTSNADSNRFLTDPRPFVTLQTVIVTQSVFVDLIRYSYHTQTHTHSEQGTHRYPFRDCVRAETGKEAHRQTHSDTDTRTEHLT